MVPFRPPKIFFRGSARTNHGGCDVGDRTALNLRGRTPSLEGVSKDIDDIRDDGPSNFFSSEYSVSPHKKGLKSISIFFRARISSADANWKTFPSKNSDVQKIVLLLLLLPSGCLFFYFFRLLRKIVAIAYRHHHLGRLFGRGKGYTGMIGATV